MRVDREPTWWLRDIVIASLVGVIVSAATIAGQAYIDDKRAARDAIHAKEQARHDERIGNLQFVRGLSSPDPELSRPFTDLDLQYQNLSGLQLVGADFAYANLADTDAAGADLSRADFSRADLRRAGLNRANLSGARFSADRFTPDQDSQPGADLSGARLQDANLTGADLSATNLTGADLRGAHLTGVRYNDKTHWPSGFQPPTAR